MACITSIRFDHLIGIGVLARAYVCVRASADAGHDRIGEWKSRKYFQFPNIGFYLPRPHKPTTLDFHLSLAKRKNLIRARITGEQNETNRRKKNVVRHATNGHKHQNAEYTNIRISYIDINIIFCSTFFLFVVIRRSIIEIYIYSVQMQSE